MFSLRLLNAPGGVKSTLALMFWAIGFFHTPVQAQQGQPPAVTVANPVVKIIVEDDEFVGRFEAESAKSDALDGESGNT